jgi:hypothetical protein
MASDAWTMSTAQFRTLWEGADASEYPIEFAYTDAGERDAGEPDASVEKLADLSSVKQSAIHALTRPQVTIALSAIDSRRPFDDARHHIRIVSATKDMTTVYLARQSLTAVSVGSTVAITREEPAAWARHLVGVLPPTPAGSLPTDTAVAFSSTPSLDDFVIATVATPPSSKTAAVFAKADLGVCGTLRIQVGSIADGRRPSSIEVRFRDVIDDGRYMLIVDDPGIAMPVDAGTFASMLNRVVNTLRKRHTAEAVV